MCVCAITFSGLLGTSGKGGKDFLKILSFGMKISWRTVLTSYFADRVVQRKQKHITVCKHQVRSTGNGE